MASQTEWQAGGQTARPVYLRWFISWLCNYRCTYCFNRNTGGGARGNWLRRPGKAIRAAWGWPARWLGLAKGRHDPRPLAFHRDDHAFRYYPPEVWGRAFGAFAPASLSLAISGGEPFLDRDNFGRMLSILTAMEHVRSIRVDTNGSWRPGSFPHVDWQKVFTNVSYHPKMIGLAAFCDSIREKLDCGVRVAMVNYVLEPSQADDFLRVKEAMDELGVFLNANVYVGDRPQSESAMSVYRRYLPDVDVALKLNRLATKGKPCGHPRWAYSVDPRGTIHVGCFPNRSGNLLAGDVPRRFEDDIACPREHCGCLDMYAFLKTVGRARRLNLLTEYVDECLAARDRVAPQGDYCLLSSRTSSRPNR